MRLAQLSLVLFCVTLAPNLSLGANDVIVRRVDDSAVLVWPRIDNLTPLGKNLYFSVRDVEPGDTDVATNWWRFDGSSFEKIGRVDPLRRDSYLYPPVSYGGALYYMANGSFEDAPRLLRFGGTTVTQIINDEYLPRLAFTPQPDPLPGIGGDSSSLPPAPDGSQLILTRPFSCCLVGNDLYQSNGFAFDQIGENITNQTRIHDIDFIEYDNNAYVLATLNPPGASPSQFSLLRYDGQNVVKLASANFQGYPMANFIGHEDSIYLAACDSGNDCALRRYPLNSGDSDLPRVEYPIVVAPTQIADPSGTGSLIATADEIHSPREFFVYNNEVYFFGSEIPGWFDGAVDYLWRIDGETVERVAQVRSFGYDSSAGDLPYHPIVFNGNVYFLAGDTITTTNVWQFDGQTLTKLTDLDFMHYTTSELILSLAGDRLYFAGQPQGSSATSLYAIEAVPEPHWAALAVMAATTIGISRARRKFAGSKRISA